MTKNDRVAAVVVTYNRKDLLLQCLDAILAQTHPVARLIVVDNASDDGTEALLQDAGHPAGDRLLNLRLPENTGGSGGFHEGLKRATAEGYDWYWLLDDDVVPQADALASLLSYKHLSECIHPLVVYDDGSSHEWEHILDPYTTHQIGLGNASFRHEKDWCPMHVACFEGMLVSKRIVERVGLPDRDFFVSGDDGLFGFKAALHTNVIYVRPARLVKKIKPSGPLTPFKIYYDLRNRFILRRKIGELIPIPRETRFLFFCFMLWLSYAHVRHAFSVDALRAAWYAWYDGLRKTTGRHRY